MLSYCGLPSLNHMVVYVTNKSRGNANHYRRRGFLKSVDKIVSAGWGQERSIQFVTSKTDPIPVRVCHDLWNNNIFLHQLNVSLFCSQPGRRLKWTHNLSCIYFYNHESDFSFFCENIVLFILSLRLAANADTPPCDTML